MRHCPRKLCECFVVTLAVADAGFAQDSGLTFDVSEYERKPFEFRGYAELSPEYTDLNQDGALYKLQFFDEEERDSIESLEGILELEGSYRQGIGTFSFRTHSDGAWEYTGIKAEHALYEGLLSLEPERGLVFDFGKKSYRWGTGYAWNPVAFVERIKDAGEPDMSREGYWVAGADWIRTFDGPLQTLAITPLVLPVLETINTDFGDVGHLNWAGKLYMLYRDTDLDFMFVSKGSRGARYGMDFAKNLAANFEIHGEFAYLEDVRRRTLTPDCKPGPSTFEDTTSYLLGLRYRSKNDITTLLEYYHNGAGNDKSVQQQFYKCAHQAWEEGDRDRLEKLPLSDDIEEGPFSRQTPMRNYLNLRIWWEEPYNILYFVPALQVLYNLDDDSYSVSPEATYTGYGNFEIRLRGELPVGDPLTEWGEKPSDWKVQLRVRYYF